jgi:septum formation protein
MPPIILASSSVIRATLLRNAGLSVETVPARIDEDTIRPALEADGASPRDIADALAEMKAARVSARHPQALVIGCDQVLEFEGRAFGKPQDAAELRRQLETLRGHTHRLLSAMVVYQGGQPLWRHVGVARLTMRPVSDAWLTGYLGRNAADLMDSVGGYKLESEGVQLFSQIEGDYFTILGLPLLPLLSWLAQRGDIPS